MDLSKTGKLIKELRREKGLTQKELSQELGISPKTVSKWETGHGFPDIDMISNLSEILGVDISKLLEGKMPEIKPDAGNVKNTKFYVCQKCGNMLTSLGFAEIVCCGRKLLPLSSKEANEDHGVNIEKMEDDYYITFSHPMSKEHYISFFSYVRYDRVLTIKLYPEQGSELRFPVMHGGKMYYYCNNHGLFELRI